MADPKYYPGGHYQYWKDRTSGDPDLQKKVDAHDWDNDPTSSEASTPNSPPSPRPSIPYNSSKSAGGDAVDELFRFRTIPVAGVLYLIFHYTPLYQMATASPNLTSRNLWSLVLVVVLMAALAICSPTAAKKLAVFVIGMMLLGIIVIAVLGFYSGLIVIHHH
jgi:hypothetical protein